VDYIGNDNEQESEPTSDGVGDSDEGVDPPSDWEAPNSVLVPEPTNPGSAGTYDGQVAPGTSQFITGNDGIVNKLLNYPFY